MIVAGSFESEDRLRSFFAGHLMEVWSYQCPVAATEQMAKIGTGARHGNCAVPRKRYGVRETKFMKPINKSILPAKLIN